MSILTIRNIDLVDNAVPDDAYKNMTYTSVIFEPSSTCIRIGNRAFKQMENLISIKLPDGLLFLGDEAVEQCMNLSSIIIPDSVQTIGIACFADLTLLTSIVIPPGVISIGYSAFHGCNGLRHIDMNNSTNLTTISYEAFNGCSNILGGIVIPDTVTDLSGRAFIYNGLVSVFFGEDSSCNTIEESAFRECPLIETVTLPQSLQKIGTYAFAGCLSLHDIVIPSGVTIIESLALHALSGDAQIYFEGDPPLGSGNLSESNNSTGYISSSSAEGSWKSIMDAGGMYRGIPIQVSATIPPRWNGGDVDVKYKKNKENDSLRDATVSWKANAGATSYSVVDEKGVAYPNQTTVGAPGSGNLKSVISGLTPGYYIFTVKATLSAGIPWGPRSATIMPRPGEEFPVYARGVLRLIADVEQTSATFPTSVFGVYYASPTTYIFDVDAVQQFTTSSQNADIVGVVPPEGTAFRDTGRRLFAFAQNNLKTHEFREVMQVNSKISYYICTWAASGIAPTDLVFAA